MTQSDYWESVDYHNLPHWLKRVSKPKQWISKTFTKIFYSKPYDYKVEYAVVHGKLHIRYWRCVHPEYPIPIIPATRSSHLLKYLLIFFVLAGVVRAHRSAILFTPCRTLSKLLPIKAPPAFL